MSRKVICPCVVSDLSALLLGMGCATATTASSENKRLLNLDEVAKIRPGNMSSQDVRALLGAPALVRPFPKPGRSLWVYRDEKLPGTRASIVLEGTMVQSVNWFIREGEPEITLPGTEMRFSDAHFVGYRIPWTRGDSAPDEEIYSDDAKGISFIYRMTRKEVSFISWYAPKKDSASGN